MFSLVINVLLTGEDTGAKEECYMYVTNCPDPFNIKSQLNSNFDVASLSQNKSPFPYLRKVHNLHRLGSNCSLLKEAFPGIPVHFTTCKESLCSHPKSQ